MQTWSGEFETVLRPHLVLLKPGAALEPDLELRAAGVDSLALIELLVSIEDAFGLEFPDALLTGDTFRTPGTLWSAVSLLRAEADRPLGHTALA